MSLYWPVVDARRNPSRCSGRASGLPLPAEQAAPRTAASLTSVGTTGNRTVAQLCDWPLPGRFRHGEDRTLSHAGDGRQWHSCATVRLATAGPLSPRQRRHAEPPRSQKPGFSEKPGFFGPGMRIRDSRFARIQPVPFRLSAGFPIPTCQRFFCGSLFDSFIGSESPV